MLFERLKGLRLSDIQLQLGRDPGQELPAEGGEKGGTGGPSWTEPMDLDEVHRVRTIFLSSPKGLCPDGARLSCRPVFVAEDLFVRSRVEPLQAVFTQWMAGAKAQVDGEDVAFRKIINWCQDCADWRKRQVLAREARALCRFLAPFSHATWQALVAAVREELGYDSYLAYCQARRRMCLDEQAKRCRELLSSGRQAYLRAADKWLNRVCPGRRLHEASRFDAIYLLGMRYMDHLARDTISLDSAMEFFRRLGVSERKGLRVHMEGSPGRQSFCVPVSIPGEVHLIVGPLAGWVDWEALFHEMGHAFSFIHTDPGLALEAREFFLSGAVSEAFAFLFQRLAMNPVFLETLARKDGVRALDELSGMHELKFQVLTRRYGAKFLIEYENFRKDRISSGQDLYARIMGRETGFFYHPETYLFDLMPDFYSLDYFLAFVASGLLEKRLKTEFGKEWFRDGQAIETLKGWASVGNLYELDEFMKEVTGTRLWPEESANAG